MLILCIPLSDSWVRKIHWRRVRPSSPEFLGFPGGSAGKESGLQFGRPGFNPWVGEIPWRREDAHGEGNALWRREWFIHSSTLAWRIPWTVYSMGSMESGRVVQGWMTSTFTFFLDFFYSTSCFAVCSSTSKIAGIHFEDLLHFIYPF